MITQNHIFEGAQWDRCSDPYEPPAILWRLSCKEPPANESAPQPIQRAIRGTSKKKRQPPGVEGCLHSLVFSNKNPGKINAGKKFNTGAVSESPPHRAWVKTVIVRQAVLLALDLRSPKPSQNFRSSGV